MRDGVSLLIYLHCILLHIIESLVRLPTFGKRKQQTVNLPSKPFAHRSKLFTNSPSNLLLDSNSSRMAKLAAISAAVADLTMAADASSANEVR